MLSVLSVQKTQNADWSKIASPNAARGYEKRKGLARPQAVGRENAVVYAYVVALS